MAEPLRCWLSLCRASSPLPAATLGDVGLLVFCSWRGHTYPGGGLELDTPPCPSLYLSILPDLALTHPCHLQPVHAPILPFSIAPSGGPFPPLGSSPFIAPGAGFLGQVLVAALPAPQALREPRSLPLPFFKMAYVNFGLSVCRSRAGAMVLWQS